MNDIKEINIMLGGETPEFEKIRNKKNWIAVDSGLEYLMENKINPIFVCGDFDSLKKYRINYDYEFIKKDNQDMTDAEFCLNIIIRKFLNLKKINIYGATGRRLDHFLANILLISNDLYRGIDISIVDNYNIIKFSEEGKNIIEYNKNYKYISFVPFFDDTIVSIYNAKYNANLLKLTKNRANATSNEFIEKKDIILETNNRCLIIYSKDN